jgi:uncharacterized protein YjbI with pentapeptide repeats
MNAAELKEVIGLHRKWAAGEAGGRRADLSRADLSRADLSDAVLSGADLRDAVLSRADLSRADLSDAVLSRADLSDADLRGAVLSGAVLSGAVLSGADLRGAVLSGAVLSGAVLSGAVLSDLLRVENLHTKILDAISNGDGRLEMGSWHTCQTTHCRAGWAITLAGPAGRTAEALVGPALAGALITLASCPWMERVPNFYASNELALEDIKACAAKEQELAAKVGAP